MHPLSQVSRVADGKAPFAGRRDSRQHCPHAQGVSSGSIEPRGIGQPGGALCRREPLDDRGSSMTRVLAVKLCQRLRPRFKRQDALRSNDGRDAPVRRDNG